MCVNFICFWSGDGFSNNFETFYFFQAGFFKKLRLVFLCQESSNVDLKVNSDSLLLELLLVRIYFCQTRSMPADPDGSLGTSRKSAGKFNTVQERDQYIDFLCC